jgi:hypothetical protein
VGSSIQPAPKLQAADGRTDTSLPIPSLSTPIGAAASAQGTQEMDWHARARGSAGLMQGTDSAERAVTYAATLGGVKGDPRVLLAGYTKA